MQTITKRFLPKQRLANERIPGKRAAAVFCVVAAGIVAMLPMTPWTSPDTASWLAPCFETGCFDGPRFPLFALIVHAIGAPSLPFLQGTAFVAGAVWLGLRVRHAGGSANAALAAGLAPLLSPMLPLWSRAILPDMLAQAALLGALGATIGSSLSLAALFTTTAILLKPGLLPFIPALPVLHLILTRNPKRSIRLFVAVATPFLLLSSYRLAAVGDFNIVSFGGFQMSGLAAAMLTDTTIGRLPADLQPPAQDIMRRRDELAAAGRLMPTPENATGDRSFVSEAAGYFDILARDYDKLLYEGVRPTQAPGESWVAFNARLQRLGLAVIRAEPMAYAAWITGAAARFIGRAITFNPGMAIAAALLLAGACRSRRPTPPADLRPLVGLVTITTLASASLTVLTSFPAARYIDAGGMLLAALPLAVAFDRLLPGPSDEISR